MWRLVKEKKSRKKQMMSAGISLFFFYLLGPSTHLQSISQGFIFFIYIFNGMKPCVGDGILFSILISFTSMALIFYCGPWKEVKER